MFQSLQKQINENELDRIRQEMINFSRQCHNKESYTQSEFDYIFKLHSKYERLIEETGLPNGVIDAEYGNSIQFQINLLEFIKLEMSEVAGINKQREG